MLFAFALTHSRPRTSLGNAAQPQHGRDRGRPARRRRQTRAPQEALHGPDNAVALTMHAAADLYQTIAGTPILGRIFIKSEVGGGCFHK